ncbi:hypothetical protein [Mesorhizobium sp. LSHC412B00]|uniref:hypothetical protein n=1 Tax=Mesorhizobium sp. LSHC412B00 TaxID=1287285 RepID=UPI0004CFA54E|nr:hypothetical protein [Mesorhizobium sp. LSHC412B00]
MSDGLPQAALSTAPATVPLPKSASLRLANTAAFLLEILVAKPPQTKPDSFRDPVEGDALAALLDEIAEEETPERLLKLALELQQQLLLSKQLKNPN